MNEARRVPHEIRYKFGKGDVLTYDQEVTLLLEEPDGSKYDGILKEESIQSVIQDHDGWWEILLTLTRLESSGPLCGELPEPLKQRSTTMRMDARGSLLDIGTGAPAPRVPAFPLDAVSPGQSWLASAPSPDGGEPLSIEYYYERLEQIGDEEIAHLVTLARSASSEGYSSEIQGTIAFSLTHGHQASSTTVVKLTWENGRVSHSVVELKLRNRTNA
jgi:hypothetical protein